MLTFTASSPPPTLPYDSAPVGGEVVMVVLVPCLIWLAQSAIEQVVESWRLRIVRLEENQAEITARLNSLLESLAQDSDE